MKVSIFLCFACIMSVFADNAFSQEAKLSLTMKDATLKQIITQIEKASDYVFLISDDAAAELGKTINISASNENITNVLTSAFENTNLAYLVTGRQVIVFSKGLKNEVPEKGNPETIVQQGINITGTVVDNAGEPIPGVNIRLKESAIGVVTDIDGKYVITVPNERAILIFSFVGYDPQEMVVGNLRNINMTLKESLKALDEVVVIGYGVQKKATVTGSVTSVSAKDLEKNPSSNLANALAGKMSGVYVSQSTGTPGIAASIRIRSIGGWTESGRPNSNVPLFVIDGIVMDETAFNMLDINEVEEISILKDAASAAIYGSRGGNGVILVTTKKGAQGVRVNVTGNVIFEKPTKIPEMIDVVKNIELDNEIFGPTRSEYFTPDEIEYFRKNGRYDWLKEAYETPVTQNYAINVAGGKDSTKYFMGASYFGQGGFLPNLSYDRYNFRGNIETKVAKHLTAGLNLSFSQGERQRYNFTYDYSSNDLNNLWGKLLYYNFWVPPYIDGKPVDNGWISHPIERMRNGGYWRTKNQYIDGLLWMKYDIPWIKGLSAQVQYGMSKYGAYQKVFDKKHLRYTFERTGGNNHIFTNKVLSSQWSSDPGEESVSYQTSESSSYQLNFQLNYDRKFGKHHVAGTLVYEQMENDYTTYGAGRKTFPIIVKDQFWAASDENKNFSTNGSESENARISYVGRLSYDYAEKYILSASLRRDGSMNFAPDERWGWFPSVSAAWRITEEDFWNIGFVNNLKFRASYGSAGYDWTLAYQWQEKYQKAAGYVFDQSIKQGINYGGIVNPYLTWEKSAAYNFGIDVQFFDHFTLVADYFINNRWDILGARVLSVPDTYGGNLPDENYGKTRGTGFELELGYKNKTDNGINYYVKGNFAYAASKYIQRDAATNAQDVDVYNGKTMDYVKGWECSGMLRTQADIENLPKQPNGDAYSIFGRKPALGMLNFQDLSGPNGSPDGKIDDYDRTVLAKHNTPPFMLGLTLGGDWHGLSLMVFFEGMAGHKKWYDDGYGRRFPAGNLAFAHWADSWSPENPNAKYPKPVDWDVTNDHAASTFWLFDGSFVRLRQINLGYSIPYKWLSKLGGIKQLQFYVQGTNLFYLSKFKFYDPEIYSQMSYPNMKTLNLGLSLTF